MKVLLDTSVCVDYLRRNPATIERLFWFKIRDVMIPVHAVAELEHGIFLAFNRKAERERVAALMARYPVLPFGPGAARRAGNLMYTLGRQGLTMKHFDLLIAAQAIDAGLTLATADADFEPLSGARGLKVAKWSSMQPG